MNLRQKLVRLIGVIALVTVGLVPPWQVVVTRYGISSAQRMSDVNPGPVLTQTKSAGFHPLWSPPEALGTGNEHVIEAHYRVNVILITVELVAVFTMLNIGVFALKIRD